MDRARAAAIYVVPASAIIIAWLRIEGPPREAGRAVALALLAVAPTLAVRLRWRLALAVGALLIGSWIALGASVATPGRVVTRLWDGVRQFYDVDLPFDPTSYPRMQAAILLAIFLFCLLLGLALAARRALLAIGVLAFGAGWPGTLVWGGRELLLGGLILAGALVILAGLRPPAKRAIFPGTVACGLVIACALGLASRPAVAKEELLNWQGWDLYTERDRSVGVSYVWNSDYSGLDWPRKRTVVLKIEAPDSPFYWLYRGDVRARRRCCLHGQRAVAHARHHRLPGADGRRARSRSQAGAAAGHADGTQGSLVRLSVNDGNEVRRLNGATRRHADAAPGSSTRAHSYKHARGHALQSDSLHNRHHRRGHTPLRSAKLLREVATVPVDFPDSTVFSANPQCLNLAEPGG